MMPLNRDSAQDDGRPLLNAEGFTSNRQQIRLNSERHSVYASRPESPQDDTKILVHNRKGSVGKQDDAVKTGKQYSLAPDEPIGNDMKLSIPSKLPPKQDKKGFQKFTATAVHQTKPVVSQKVHRALPVENGNPFDTTESLNMSFGDDDYEENQDTIQIPQARARQNGRENLKCAEQDNESRTRVFSVLQGLGKSDPNYSDDVNVGRELLNSRGPAVGHNVEQDFSNSINQHNERDRRISFGSDSMLPDTPSRSRSAPVQNDILAPVARKSVAIHSSPQFMNSPVLRSEETAREDSPDILQSRPRSALSGHRGMTLPQRSQQRQPLPHSQLRESQTAAPGRFQTAGGHNRSIQMRDQKVSAPESDVPESSEDERPTHLDEKVTYPPVNSYIDKKLSDGRKRSHDEIDTLDYSPPDLKKKTLAQLQDEPFIQDPKRDPGPQVDHMGNNVSLSQVFEKWSKLSDDVIREIFQSQSDDEWSETGKWFVNSFQADLKELMEVRLERRKIALDFEHKIRRRQREVEHYRAGLHNELRELQEGGSGLLKDRKMTTGSRSNTPMKTRPR